VEIEDADRGVAPEPSNNIRSAPPTASAVPIPRWGLGAFVLVELTRLAVSGGFLVALAHNRPVTVPMVTLALAVPTVTAALLAVLITTWRGNGPRTDLRLQWSWRGLRIGLMFGIGALLVTLPASRIYIKVAGPHASSAVGAAFAGARAGLPVAAVVFLVVVIVGPFCEEIVYRGLLWGAVERRWGRWVALVATTVVFALAHLEFTRFALLLVVAIPIALARLYSGNLTAAIVAHQLTNLPPGVYLVLALIGTVPPSY
jgi:CAAX protease family protein